MLHWDHWILKGIFSFPFLFYCTIQDLLVGRYFDYDMPITSTICWVILLSNTWKFVCSRTDCSCWSLSCFWQIFLSPSLCCFSSIGFLLGLSLLCCSFFPYHYFLPFQLAWTPYSVKNLEEFRLHVFMHCGMLHLYRIL